MLLYTLWRKHLVSEHVFFIENCFVHVQVSKQNTVCVFGISDFLILLAGDTFFVLQLFE